jgi:hypothetical protein
MHEVPLAMSLTIWKATGIRVNGAYPASLAADAVAIQPGWFPAKGMKRCG